MTAGTQRADVPELDVLRGWAAILMIVNHAGYRLLSPVDAGTGISGLAVFIGSFAPVLFFFATGFGVGLGVTARGRPPAFAETMWKALLLVLADQVGYWRHGEAFGLDFFSFIGIASVLVNLVARSRRSTQLSLALAAAILVVRYGAGPFVRRDLPDVAVVDWLTGLRGLADVSYPFSPWMVYPLLGFALGRIWSGAGLAQHGSRWWRAASAVSVASFMLTAAMLWNGANLLRWSTMSASYFTMSLGVLAGFAMLSVAALRAAPIGRALALRGVASFAVIPVHFALLGASEQFDLPLAPGAFAAAAVAVILLSWLGATLIAGAIASERVTRWRPRVLPGLLALLAACVAIVVFVDDAVVATTAMFLAQFTIAALLGLRRPLASPDARLQAVLRV